MVVEDEFEAADVEALDGVGEVGLVVVEVVAGRVVEYARHTSPSQYVPAGQLGGDSGEKVGLSRQAASSGS